ncbi:MAG: amino acid permease [Victivallaceae bacterium]
MTEQQTNKNIPVKKLGVIGLAGIVISSMVGGGIFSLPQNMASTAYAGSVLLAWLLTGIGFYFIANTFRTLSELRPDLKTGIYMYAREGFGPFVGFLIGWGYWLCQICGNVGYAVITMDALNYFFPPYFSGGNTIPAIIGGSILIWFFNFLVLRGVRQASFVNIVGTICKLLPLIIFIAIMGVVFRFSQFGTEFWGPKIPSALKGVGIQIKSTMLVTLWSFIGIEGAVVLSGRAKSQNAVGKATILGFLGCWIMYLLLSILPFGSLSQADLSKIPNPSTAGVLSQITGNWGADLMNVGLLIAILTSWLAWTMVTAEIPFAAAQNGTFPKIFTKQNKHLSPSVSLYITSALMQLGMLLVYFASNAWNTMLSITGVMVLPAYFTSAAFLYKCSKQDSETNKNKKLKWSLFTGILGSLYALWLIYAAGIHYLLMACIFLTVGIPIYVWTRKNSKNTSSISTESTDMTNTQPPVTKVPLFGVWGILGTIVLTLTSLATITLVVFPHIETKLSHLSQTFIKNISKDLKKF